MPHITVTSKGLKGQLTMVLSIIVILSGFICFVVPKMALQVPQGELIIEPIVDNENEDYGDNIPQETGIIPRETRNGEEDYLSLVAEIGHGLNIGYQNSITYADVDNDGITEILFANEDGYIHVIQYLGGDYIDEWRSPNLDWEPYGLAVGDTDSDGTVEIVVGNHYGTIYIFGYQGPGIGYVKEWEYQLNKEEPYGIVVGNLDDDEYQEIVIGALQLVSAEENVFVFGYDGSTYVEEYRYLMTDFLNYAHSVVISDVDSDGTDEFVVGTMEFKMGTQTPRGTFYVFGHNGNDYAVEYKRPDISDWVGDLDCGDVDDDGNPEIVVSGASVNIYQYESGAYFIENNIPEEHPKLQVGDVNNDGQIEIVTGYWELKVWQEDTLLWESETYEQEIYSVAIVDSDSDLQNEILFTKGVMDWYSDLYILGYSSLIFIEEWISDYLPSISSISVDDVNSDGENDLILATRPGDLIIFEDPMNQLQVRDAKKIEVGFEIIHVFCGNFDNDSTVDIVVTDTNDIIYFLEFDGVDYIIVDQIQIVDDSFVAADIDDIDDDGKIELVVATLNGYVHVVGYDGSYEIEWTDLIAENGITAITTGDSDNDGVKEILVGGFDNILHILIYDGSDYVEIREQLMSGMIFTLGIGDTDYDGKNELVAELGFFELRVFEWNGTYYVVNWSATFYEDANNEAMDVDFIESTNKDLIVFGTFKLYVIGYNTTYEFLYQSETYTSKVQSLIIGDLDKSGKNEILVSIGSYIFIYGKELRPLASLFVSKPTVNVGEEITFDGSFSKGIGTLEYFFDFGDGINTGWTSESVTTHSYSAGGTYEASLKIKDENGIESTNFAEITITVLESNVAPMAFIDEIYPSKATYKETVSFSGHGDDEDGTITSHLWESSIDGHLSDDDSFTSSSLSLGKHTIYFKVEDDEGTWSETVQSTLEIVAEVQNQAPKAFIDSISPNPATEGETITFTGHGVDNDGAIESYSWESNIDGFLSSESSFGISSLSVGEHTITFKVEDDKNLWSEPDTITLLVEEAEEGDGDGGDGGDDGDSGDGGDGGEDGDGGGEGEPPGKAEEEGDFKMIALFGGIIAVIIIIICASILAFSRKKESTTGPATQINCPGCGTVFGVASTTRPLPVQCPGCGLNGVINE